jgi:hypothetical protein
MGSSRLGTFVRTVVGSFANALSSSRPRSWRKPVPVAGLGFACTKRPSSRRDPLHSEWPSELRFSACRVVLWARSGRHPWAQSLRNARASRRVAGALPRLVGRVVDEEGLDPCTGVSGATARSGATVAVPPARSAVALDERSRPAPHEVTRRFGAADDVVRTVNPDVATCFRLCCTRGKRRPECAAQSDEDENPPNPHRSSVRALHTNVNASRVRREWLPLARLPRIAADGVQL